MRAAAQSILPEQPTARLPAQLRYRGEVDFRALFRAAGGLDEPVIMTQTARLGAPSARWLSERIGFAPGHDRHDDRSWPSWACCRRALR
jgi:hypothetical protein